MNHLSFNKSEVEASVSERFAQVVSHNPEALAVVDSANALTYGQLNSWATRIARQISSRSAPALHVALLFGYSVGGIAAALGALQAAKCYVPFAPDDAQLPGQFEDAEPGMIITDDHHFQTAARLAAGRVPLLNIDRLDEDTEREVVQMQTACAQPGFPCVLLYTSGSSGRPKGVHYSHRSVLYGGWIQGNCYGIHPEDRIAQVFHPASGGALGDVDAALLNGASLWLFDPATTGIESFKEWLRRSRITILHPPVSFFRAFADSIVPGEAMAMSPSGTSSFPDLRLIVLAGQTVQVEDVERFRKHFLPHSRLVNRLASSEGGGILTHFFIEPTIEIDTETVPVGFANEDICISIHDDAGIEVADGESGEIFVRSPYVAPSYWRRPDLDSSRFLPDPDDPGRRIAKTGDLGRRHPGGLIEHLGRKDLMVKIRGFRVELAAVESALMAVEGVQESVVVSANGGGTTAKAQGEPRLVAYLVAKDPALPPTVAQLREALKSRLPNAALPASYIFLDTLPLTTTGKPDRVSLAGRPIPSFRPNLDVPYRSPASAAETRIAAIWAEVLGIDGLGVDDPFLDLGGDSILAARIVARVLSDPTLSRKPDPAEPVAGGYAGAASVAKLLAMPTVAGMAALMQASENDDAGRRRVAQGTEHHRGSETLSELLAELEALTDEQAERDLYQENQS